MPGINPEPNPKLKAVYFDLDSTLIHGDPSRPYKETVPVLDYLTEQKKTIAMVSFSGIGVDCAAEVGIIKYFQDIRSANSLTGSKRGYITVLLAQHKLNKDEVVFVDDLQENIDDITDFGIQCIHVDERKGITLAQIKAAGL